MIRVGTFASGIGAPEVAMRELSGWHPVFFSEIEPFPCAVLAHHWPDVPNLGDMTAVDGSEWRGKVDVVVAGTPCFTAGHMVITRRGYVPIEEIAAGDMVLTHKGRLRRVVLDEVGEG